jgi:hypothetical protein
VFAAFDQGQIPRIACFNRATVALETSLGTLVDAMQEYVNRCVVPVWGTPARLVTSKTFLKGAWAMMFLDDADAQDALAYHDLTPDGFPLSKVFVRTIRDAGESLSVSASHELVEMLVDPGINLYSTGPDDKAVYAYESADPVEALSFDVNGVQMSDFVYPSYFEVFRKAGSTKFDYMGKVKRPFQILSGGYQIILKNGKWQTLSSKSKKAALQREDRRQHRSEARRHWRRMKAYPKSYI